MPNFSSPIDDLQWTLERPVVYEIVRQLLDITKISHKTPISFAGDEEKQSQAGSTVEAIGPENRWSYDERVFITVEEEYDINTLGNTAVSRIEHEAFIEDTELGVSMRPVYATSKLKIGFKYRARDKNQAHRWRTERRMRTSQMQECGIHELTYHYRIPEVALNVLKEVYRLRESTAGCGQTYNEYLTSIALRNVGLVTNQSMSDAVWVVNERQLRVVGYWDYTGAPEKEEKDGAADAWVVGFSYDLEYSKPIGCQVRYPLVVHNQLIGSDYRPQAPAYKLEDRYAARSISGQYIKAFETDSLMQAMKGDTGVSLPSFDDWVPKGVLNSTVRLFTAATLLDPNQPRFLFNLGDLGDYALMPEVLDFLKQTEYPYLGLDYRSVFSLSLYKGVSRQDPGSLVVDANLNVYASTDLDLRQMYHVRMGLVTNFNYLHVNAIRRLQSTPVAGLLVRSINGAMHSQNLIRRDIKTNSLSDIDMRSVLGKSVNLPAYRGGFMYTVMDLFVKGKPMAQASTSA